MIKTPMMLLLSGEDAKDKKLMEFSIADIAKQGFDAICLEFRVSNYDERDEIGREAIRFAESECRKHGMGFVIILPHCSKWILDKYPTLCRKIAKAHKIVIEGDEAYKVVPAFRNLSPEKIVSAFNIKRDEHEEVLSAENVTDKVILQNGVLHYPGIEGEISVYIEYTVNEADYAHKDAEIILDECLDIYKDYKLDGFALDEFGAGTRIADAYLCGDDFLAKFKTKYGYDFQDKIYLMDNKSTSTEFAKVRCDYYSLTNEVTYEYQMAAKKRFSELWGDDLFIGFHHTWYGEGNSGDLWSGAIDYFELSDVLSGGFVDAQYDAERTMHSLGLIAESVAKYSPTGMAYNMCWDRFSTVNKMEYFQRTLAVRNINWVGHAYTKSFSRGKPLRSFIFDFSTLGKFWGDTSKYIERERIFSEFIGKLQSKPKVAITYNWESCAYFNNDYMHFHRLSLKALADKLVVSNIPADIVPSYETDFSQYEVIFALWPTMMPKVQWEALKKAINDGKKVYFIGPPARVTTDGENISAEFEEMVGAHIVEIERFWGGYEYIAWDLWFTDKRIEMMTYLDADRTMDFENGNVRYYGYELPLTEMFFNVLEELKPYQTIESNKVISKEFHSEDEHILTVTSRWQSKINEKFTFCGYNFEIKNGLLVGIKIKNGKIEIISEAGADIFVDGKEFCYTEI